MSLFEPQICYGLRMLSISMFLLNRKTWFLSISHSHPYQPQPLLQLLRLVILSILYDHCPNQRIWICISTALFGKTYRTSHIFFIQMYFSLPFRFYSGRFDFVGIEFEMQKRVPVLQAETLQELFFDILYFFDL